jgi:hypothetical protein
MLNLFQHLAVSMRYETLKQVQGDIPVIYIQTLIMLPVFTSLYFLWYSSLYKKNLLLLSYITMALTGDLEHLHIVDIIQLINTARKSGTFSVMSGRGKSSLIFSNGYIVGANHLNNRIRIGSVLVKMDAIAPEDLAHGLEVQKNAGKNRKPLISTLIGLGKLGHNEASRGLKKLIEMTLVELIGWSKGTFTLDTEAVVVSPECCYPLSKMEQEITIDSQMILMDALRIFDEKERDRNAGITGLSDEEFYAEEISSEEAEPNSEGIPSLTADDLGLGDLDHLERKIPQFLPVNEIFDPLEIHRQKIKETLAEFSAEEQETFVSFLDKSLEGRAASDRSQRQEAQTKGLILLSEDELIKHSVMTICKDEGVLVFATDGEEELLRILDQCLTIKVLPVLVFDYPGPPGGLLSLEKIVSLRQQAREMYPQVPIIQIASIKDYSFMLQSLSYDIRAVFPKPSRDTQKTTFITDTIKFLETFKSYIKDFFHQQQNLSSADQQISRVKERISSLHDLIEPSAVSLALLQYVSEMCERSISFIVGQTELTGEKAIGVYDEKKAGPTSVTRLKIPLKNASVLRNVVEKGSTFYGVREDEVLNKHLFEAIGVPLSPTMLILPVKSLGKIALVIYGDFGGKEASDVQTDALEILAHAAGLALENALHRKQFKRAAQK